MGIKKYIPNLFTLLNLFCGCIAVIFAVYGFLVNAIIFVFLGIFFDFFDGFLARKLNTQSPLGVQLDSLADMVTSGVVPGIVMFQLISLSLADWNTIGHNHDHNLHLHIESLLPFVGLFIPLASAYRLAVFNLDEEQQSYFKGLPTPANTLLILSLALILEYQNNTIINSIIVNPYFLIFLTFLSCYLLNSNIKLFALKFKDWSFKNNATRYIFLAIAIVLLVVFQFLAIPIVIAFYLFLSLLNQKSIL